MTETSNGASFENIEIEDGYVHNGAIRLHYRAAGPKDGEPVLLLHGFPQFSYEWRYHLPRLAADGFRVITPDLRGYNLSDKPAGVEAYKMRELVGDVLAFYKAFGWSSANVVAHDWGGAVAWAVALFRPDVVKRLVAINIPHPSAFRTALQNLTQVQRSWYIWFFQTPEAPERYLAENLDHFTSTIMFDAAKPGTFSDDDRRAYNEMLAQPGQLEAALNWYRANMNPAALYSGPGTSFPKLTMPVKLIYGENDFAFAPSVWPDTAQYCTNYQAVALPGISHWSVEEAPAEVLEQIRLTLRD